MKTKINTNEKQLSNYSIVYDEKMKGLKMVEKKSLKTNKKSIMKNGMKVLMGTMALCFGLMSFDGKTFASDVGTVETVQSGLATYIDPSTMELGYQMYSGNLYINQNGWMTIIDSSGNQNQLMFPNYFGRGFKTYENRIYYIDNSNQLNEYDVAGGYSTPLNITFYSSSNSLEYILFKNNNMDYIVYRNGNDNGNIYVRPLSNTATAGTNLMIGNGSLIHFENGYLTYGNIYGGESKKQIFDGNGLIIDNAPETVLTSNDPVGIKAYYNKDNETYYTNTPLSNGNNGIYDKDGNLIYSGSSTHFGDLQIIAEANGKLFFKETYPVSYWFEQGFFEMDLSSKQVTTLLTGDGFVFWNDDNINNIVDGWAYFLDAIPGNSSYNTHLMRIKLYDVVSGTSGGSCGLTGFIEPQINTGTNSLINWNTASINGFNDFVSKAKNFLCLGQKYDLKQILNKSDENSRKGFTQGFMDIFTTALSSKSLSKCDELSVYGTKQVEKCKEKVNYIIQNS